MRKVLVVEDSLPIVALHKNIVHKSGMEPVVATTFAEVKALKSRFNEFYCAIIDYSLPDAPNGEAIKYILDEKVPGIVMTGMLDDNVREHILQLPVIDYVTKSNKQAFQYVLTLLRRLNENPDTKILVVDDSARARSYLSHLLKRHNFSVLEADSGVTALEVLNEHTDIKLIITDKEMPLMDGIELCNQVRARYTKDDIAIIGVSGVDSKALTAMFIKNGANDFLQKPFCLEEFYCRVLQNIDYLKNIETIRRQANTDYLTDLANRRYFFDSVQPLMSTPGHHIIAMLDIDNFKSINDKYGHDAGDEVLKTIARVLKKHFEQLFLVARLGGEEFAVFFNQNPTKDTIKRLERFRIELQQTHTKVGKESIACSVSIGVASEENTTIHDLMITADQRLYTAKDTGKNKVVFR